LNPIYEEMQTSVFERMSLLAAKHGAVNLGQGFPDFGWPDEILDAAARALKADSNQYAPSRGLAVLRQAVAEHYNRWFGQSLGPDSVCVTSGATEALAACILATVTSGDEVIIFTPAYDSYAPMIRRAGGTVREIALRPPEWRMERDEVESAIGPKTRAILFNNPQNPTGRLFGRDELQVIADVAVEHDLTVISDEVWEHVLLDGQEFTPIATLPGMAERTLKVGSAGKIFSLTGWKVGWIVAAPEMAGLAARAHQFLTFSTAPNLQAAGYATLHPASTYFLCLDLEQSGIGLDDENFATAAAEKAGVAVVPVSAFAEKDPARHIVRLCFAKRDETLDAGIAAMLKAKEVLA
jgi:aspartate/methionine/tyrosine aminotransferase